MTTEEDEAKDKEKKSNTKSTIIGKMVKINESVKKESINHTDNFQDFEGNVNFKEFTKRLGNFKVGKFFWLQLFVMVGTLSSPGFNLFLVGSFSAAFVINVEGIEKSRDVAEYSVKVAEISYEAQRLLSNCLNLIFINEAIQTSNLVSRADYLATGFKMIEDSVQTIINTSREIEVTSNTHDLEQELPSLKLNNRIRMNFGSNFKRVRLQEAVNLISSNILTLLGPEDCKLSNLNARFILSNIPNDLSLRLIHISEDVTRLLSDIRSSSQNTLNILIWVVIGVSAFIGGLGIWTTMGMFKTLEKEVVRYYGFKVSHCRKLKRSLEQVKIQIQDAYDRLNKGSDSTGSNKAEDEQRLLLDHNDFEQHNELSFVRKKRGSILGQSKLQIYFHLLYILINLGISVSFLLIYNATFQSLNDQHLFIVDMIQTGVSVSCQANIGKLHALNYLNSEHFAFEDSETPQIIARGAQLSPAQSIRELLDHMYDLEQDFGGEKSLYERLSSADICQVYDSFTKGQEDRPAIDCSDSVGSLVQSSSQVKGVVLIFNAIEQSFSEFLSLLHLSTVVGRINKKPLFGCSQRTDIPITQSNQEYVKCALSSPSFQRLGIPLLTRLPAN